MEFIYRGWECRQSTYALFTWQTWVATHPSYDGAPDSPTRCCYVNGETPDMLKVAIDEWILENED